MVKQPVSVGIERATVPSIRSGEDPIQYLDEVVRYAYARLGSREDAEDVAMEVIHAAFRFGRDLSRKQNPTLYLIGITRRKVADHLRNRTKQRGAKTVSIDDPSVLTTPTEPDTGLSELMQALDALPELQRDVLILKYLIGFSTNEIAVLIRKTPKAANSLLQRGRESLAKYAPHLISDASAVRSNP